MLQERMLSNFRSIIHRYEDCLPQELRFEEVSDFHSTLDINIEDFYLGTIDKIVSVFKKYPQYLTHETIGNCLRIHFNLNK